MINTIEVLTSDINVDQICRMNKSGDGSLYTLEIMFINKDIQVFRYPTKQERDRDRCRILGLPEPVWIDPSLPEPEKPTTPPPQGPVPGPTQNTNNEVESESDQSPKPSTKWQ